MIKKIVNSIWNESFVIAFFVCLSALLFIPSCKKESYIPRKSDALLARLNFSDGIKLTEKFDSNTFEYNLKINKTTASKSIGFFAICIPDNPNAKCKMSIKGKATVQEVNRDIPFNKDLSIPFVPLKLKLKTSSLFASLSSMQERMSDDEVMQDRDFTFDLPPNLPFDPNNPPANLPDLPINPHDPDFPQIPNVPGLPSNVLIKLSTFDLKIVVMSPDDTEKTYIVHGKVESM